MVIMMVAIGWGTYEVGWGGARESVLVLVGGLFALAAGVNVDHAIREKRRDTAD